MGGQLWNHTHTNNKDRLHRLCLCICTCLYTHTYTCMCVITIIEEERPSIWECGSGNTELERENLYWLEGWKRRGKLCDFILIKTYKNKRNSEKVLRKNIKQRNTKPHGWRAYGSVGVVVWMKNVPGRFLGFLPTGLTLGTVRDPVSNE